MLLLKTRALDLGDSNRSGTHNYLVDKQTQAFSQTGQMTDLCCDYLSVRCIWLYVIMSRTSFRVNLQDIVCLNVKELLAWSRCHIWSKSDSNGIRTHNQIRDKICTYFKYGVWVWVPIPLLSLKLQIWCLFRARSPWTFMQTIERRFTLKHVRDMIITFSQMHRTNQYWQESSIICQSGEMVEYSFTN